MIAERVHGERFTSPEPTARLSACIDAAAEAVAAALPGATVQRAERRSFGPATELVPCLAVGAPRANGGDRSPDLVVEFRTESTSRYALGPKRLVYSRHRVPEMWFVDPWRGRVALLRETPAGDYGWPPEERGPGDVMHPCRFDGAEVEVAALLAGWPAGVGRAPEPGEQWWEV